MWCTMSGLEGVAPHVCLSGNWGQPNILLPHIYTLLGRTLTMQSSIFHDSQPRVYQWNGQTVQPDLRYISLIYISHKCFLLQPTHRDPIKVHARGLLIIATYMAGIPNGLVSHRRNQDFRKDARQIWRTLQGKVRSYVAPRKLPRPCRPYRRSEVYWECVISRSTLELPIRNRVVRRNRQAFAFQCCATWAKNHIEEWIHLLRIDQWPRKARTIRTSRPRSHSTL